MPQLLLDTTLISQILGWKSFMRHALAGGGGGAGVTQPSPLIFPSPPRAEKAQLLLDTTLIFRILGWK